MTGYQIIAAVLVVIWICSAAVACRSRSIAAIIVAAILTFVTGLGILTHVTRLKKNKSQNIQTEFKIDEK